MTIIEKIISYKLQHTVSPGVTVWLPVDLVTARDFAGPNAVLKFEQEFPGEAVFNSDKIMFTFDCGHDLRYTNNQNIVRDFAAAKGIERISEIDKGIGSLVVMEQGLASPGRILTGTDSHYIILGAVNALGIPVGDTQTAFALKTGLVEYTVPHSMKVILRGKVEFPCSAKDIALHVLKTIGAKGALGRSLEFEGETIDSFTISDAVTLASLGAEMSAKAVFIKPNKHILHYISEKSQSDVKGFLADDDAHYEEVIEIDVTGLEPLVAKPGDPRDVVPVSELDETPLQQALIGSCTNSTYEDIWRTSLLLDTKKVHRNVRFYVVPGTPETMTKLAAQGVLTNLVAAGASVYPPACAGCTSEQVGKLGQGTVAIDTGNRNFFEKQGPGVKYLASPETVIASAIAGQITTFKQPPNKSQLKHWQRMPAPLSENEIFDFKIDRKQEPGTSFQKLHFKKPTVLKGRCWVIGDGSRLLNDVDTDAIYHNSRLQETDPDKMGQFTFEQFPAYPLHNTFYSEVKRGDILIVGDNFGAGSSREHAVKCFMALGIQAIVGKSFAPIYDGNADVLGFPLVKWADLDDGFAQDGDEIEVNLANGLIRNLSKETELQGVALSDSKMLKYQAGGLFGLAKSMNT